MLKRDSTQTRSQKWTQIARFIGANMPMPIPDSKVNGANMGPTWGRQGPGGPQVGHVKLAIWNTIDAILNTKLHLVYWNHVAIITSSRIHTLVV